MPSPWVQANTVWKDAPDTSTPILAAKLQHIDDGVDDLKELTWKLTYDEPTNILTMAGGLRANSYYVSGALLASTHLSDGASLVKTTDSGTVSTVMLANSAVTGAKLQSSITLPGTPLLTADPVGSDVSLKIASTQWVRAAITTYGATATIADNSVANIKLVDKTVTNAKIADATIVQSLFPATMIDGSAAVASLRTLGAGAAQAAAGNDARLSDTRTPTDGSVTDVKVNAAAAIAWSKISKTGSSLLDLATRSAGDLNSGTLLAARLPATAVQTTDTGTVTNTMLAGSIAVAKLATGTEGYALRVVSGVPTWAAVTGTYPGSYPIANADVSATAAIAYSKLNLATSIVNADISATAAIAKSKLAALAIADADVAAGAAIAKSKLAALNIADADVATSAAISYSKLNLTGSIINADISLTANIAKSKLAALAIVDADVAAGAAIAKSKLAALAIVDADVAAGAAISKSKLAALSIGDADVAVGAAIAWSKISKTGSSLADLTTRSAADLTTGTLPNARLSAVPYSALTLTGSIVNADVATGAAIAVSKLAAGTNGYTLQTVAGVPTWAATPAAYAGSYPIVDADISASAAIAWSKISKTGSSLADLVTRSATDLTSGTLPNARLSAVPYSALALTGSIVNADISTSAGIAITKLAAGTNGYVLSTVAGVPTWTAPGSASVPDPLSLTGDITAQTAGAAQTQIGAYGPSSQAAIRFGGDVSLYRILSGSPATTPRLVSSGGIDTSSVGTTATGAALRANNLVGTAGYAFSAVVAGEANERFSVVTDSTKSVVLNFGAGGASVPDTNLYRAAANALKTDDAFNANSLGSATGIAAQDYLAVNQADNTPSGGAGAIFFGSSWDTHISRRTGGAISPWLFVNRAINAPDLVLGGPWYDIRFYGAVPGATTSGQYSANQTAIQNAFTAAGSTGGIVFVPRGIWSYTGPITVPSNIRVVGVKGKAADPSHASVLTQTGGGNLLDMSGCVDVEFENVYLWNQGAHGIYMSGSNYTANVTFRDVQFLNYGSGHMIYFNTSAGQGNERWLWNNCVFTAGGVNQYFVASIGADFFDKMNFTECVFEDFNGYAIYSNALAIRSFRMAGCVTHGIITVGCRGTLYMTGVTAGHGIVIERQYTEGSSDRGTTAQITQQGDFVFIGSSIHPTFISGHLNSASGNPAPVCANAVNISGSGANALYMVNTSYAGAITDPSGIKHIL